jgi:hypothetical protein
MKRYSLLAFVLLFLIGATALAQPKDSNKILTTPNGFEGEAPRANAVIAIARSVLEEKKK